MPSVDNTQTSDMPSQTIHDIDPNGDLVLIVGSDGPYNGVDGVVGVGVVASFRIHSGNLCRASSVFRAMLTGSFREARRRTDSEQWTVELPDDDPTAFGLLLMIIHSHFDKVPSAIDIQALYDITILTDKYDMTAILRPWASTWLLSINREREDPRGLTCLRPINREGDKRVIWIAWELGDMTLFEQMANRLLDTFQLNERGNVMVGANRVSPEKYLDSIGLLCELSHIFCFRHQIKLTVAKAELRSHRSELLNECLQKLSDLYHRFSDEKRCLSKTYFYRLGSVVSSTIHADSFPLGTSAEDINLSLYRLRQLLRKSRIDTMCGHELCICSTGIRGISESVLARKSDALSIPTTRSTSTTRLGRQD